MVELIDANRGWTTALLYALSVQLLQLQVGRGRNVKIVFSVTVTSSLGFLDGIIDEFKKHGYTITIVSGGDASRLKTFAKSHGISHHYIKMSRRPSLIKDVQALIAWLKFLRTSHPEITVVGTPKAALLGSIAAFLVRIPNRTLISHGLRLEGYTGIKRGFLWIFEKLSHLLSTKTIAVSNSLKRRLIELNLVQPNRIVVCEPGSANGIDLSKFSAPDLEDLTSLRKTLCIRSDAFVIGFVGRITRDKGLHTLINAFKYFERTNYENLILVVAGREDGPESEGLIQQMERMPNCLYLGYRKDIRNLMAITDILCLPSKREGFPNVVLEAAAMGTPTIGADVTGIQDAIVDTETGYLFKYDDTDGLIQKIRFLFTNREELNRVSCNAQSRVTKQFPREVIAQKYYDEITRVTHYPRCSRGSSFPNTP